MNRAAGAQALVPRCAVSRWGAAWFLLLAGAYALSAQAPTVSAAPATQPVPAPLPAAPPPPARVVEERFVPGASLAGAVDRIIAGASGGGSADAALRGWIKPSERIGIKINAGGVGRDLVAALVARLRSAGFTRITVWDRTARDLIDAGYLDAKKNPLFEGARIRWTQNGAGYNRKTGLFAPASGTLIFGDIDFRAGTTETQVGNLSYLSSILTNEVDKVIVLAPARAARGVGIAGTVAAALIDNLDNWRRFYRPGGSNGLAEVWQAAELDKKVVLAIVDARTVQIAGGPERNAIYTRPMRSLFASTDPFAVDRRLLEMIEPMARAENLPSLRQAAGWLGIDETR